MVLPYDVDSTWVNPGSKSLDAGELRRADGAMFAGDGSAIGARGGIVRHGDTSLSVSVSASDVVTIQPGPVVIPGNAVAGTGCYRSALPAAITGNLAARDAVNGRIDLVVFRQLDTDVVGSHTAYTARVEVIAGTPSATPSAPALPSMAVELARITVPVSGGASASVDLSRRTYTVAAGGVIPVPDAARLPANAATGQRALALNTGIIYRWDGLGWASTGWRDYSPAVTGVAATVLAARYSRTDDGTIIGHVRIQLGGAPTSQVAIGLPTPADVGSFPFTQTNVVGVAAGLRTGTKFRMGHTFLSATDTLSIYTDGGAAGGWGPGFPETWASGDTWEAHFSYEPSV